MKKKYIIPELDIFFFFIEDVMVASFGGDLTDDDYFDNDDNPWD